MKKKYVRNRVNTIYGKCICQVFKNRSKGYQIEKELQALSANLNEANKLKYKNLQDQLNEIIENEVKGVILRSLCNDYEKGEKCTKYFFTLEKYRAKQKTMRRLKLSSGAKKTKKVF